MLITQTSLQLATKGFTKEDIQEICRYEQEPEGVEFIEETDWLASHKSQYKVIYVKRGEKYFALPVSRDGSYYTEWNYEYPSPSDVYEVKPVEVISTIWQPVQNKEKKIEY